MQQTILSLLEILGTLANAMSGIRLASSRRFDLFGAYVVGLVTAIGGGTLRDLMLNISPFWMNDGSYLAVTGIALLIVIFFRKVLVKMENTFFIFDTIGLSLFVVVGIQKTLEAGFSFWVAIVMGTITGAAGGVIRDILINEVPLIFRKEIYALACVVGGFFYWVCFFLDFGPVYSSIIGALGVALTRIIAVKYGLSLPILKGESHDNSNETTINKS